MSAKPRPAKRVDSADERPPAPWGSAPLAELVILAGIVALAIGVFGGQPDRDRHRRRPGRPRAASRWRSASTSPATAPTRRCSPAAAFVLTTGLVFYAADQILAVALAIGAVVFAIVFYLARRAFQRASGGLSYRVGGMRG